MTESVVRFRADHAGGCLRPPKLKRMRPIQLNDVYALAKVQNQRAR